MLFIDFIRTFLGDLLVWGEIQLGRTLKHIAGVLQYDTQSNISLTLCFTSSKPHNSDALLGHQVCGYSQASSGD